MRVTWVHPSWRDLVIDYLSSDDDARVRFLRSCSVHGALLAFSSGGGERGQRWMPLLKRDADWDALTDRLYDLAPDLEQPELIGILDALQFAIDGNDAAPDSAEMDALSRALLARLASVWKATRAPIALPALEAWLAVGKRLSPRPVPPAIGFTWAELVPASAPDFSDRASLERFADWLTLAELLRDYDPKLLDGLGFPDDYLQPCYEFVDALEDAARLSAGDIDQAVRALTGITKLLRSLAERADNLRYHFESRQYAYEAPAPDPRRSSYRERQRGTGHLDVQRVLKDL